MSPHVFLISLLSVLAGGLPAGLWPGRCARLSPRIRQSLPVAPPAGRSQHPGQRVERHLGLLQRILSGCRVGVGAQNCLQPGQPDEVQQADGREEQVQELQVPEGCRARRVERSQDCGVVRRSLILETPVCTKYRDGGPTLTKDCLTRFFIALRFVPDLHTLVCYNLHCIVLYFIY